MTGCNVKHHKTITVDYCGSINFSTAWYLIFKTVARKWLRCSVAGLGLSL